MGVRSLHLCTSAAWGGLELYACTLMVELNRAGAGVVAICKPHSPAESFLLSRGVRVLHLPSSRLLSLASIGLIGKIVREHGVDAVHVHYHRDIWPASLALRGDTARRLVLGIYMGVPSKNDPVHRFIYGRVDAIVTSSEDLNSRLPDLYPVPESRIHFLPYGRCVEQYRKDEGKRSAIRAAYGVKPTDILVGTMLRIDPGKGVMDFARSFSYIDNDARPRVSYLIVGEPTRRGNPSPGESPYEPHCEAYLRDIEAFIAAEGLGERIHLAGFQDDLVGYLSAMDIFVFPSRDELYSLVVLDAMFMELPVVAAAAGGNLRQVEEGVTGLLYGVADARELAGKVSRYVADSGLRRQHGKAARASVERNHDMKETIRKLLEIYSDRSRRAGT